VLSSGSSGDAPPGIAWLDVSIGSSPSWPTRLRIGPLGLQIAPVDVSRRAFYFKGARLRGVRCMWAAASLNGALLTRPARPRPPDASPMVQVLIRGESSGSVFDPASTFSKGVLRVVDPCAEVSESFHANSHLYTLGVHQSTVGVEPASLAEMLGGSFALNEFQVQLVRSMVRLMMAGPDQLESPSAMVGVDRYLGAFTGLLLRTVVSAAGESDGGATVRARTEALIDERATDPRLTPGTIATELNISLRQLYRAFSESESPAALIRRRRLERAAELLASRRQGVNVEMVALECGFASAEYFSRAFRREFGLSPRAYRSRYREVAVSR